MAKLTDYLDFIPSANSSKPNFLSSLSAALQPFVDLQNTMDKIPDGYDIDNAIGAQLDVVGEWVGLSRKLSVPITGVYFAFDTEGVGFDQGIWFGPGNPIDGITSLDDETYRLMLKIKIAANTWDGSFEEAQKVLGAIASEGTLLFIQDNFDMSATIGVSGTVPSLLFVQLLRKTYDWLRPGAVSIDRVAVTSVSGSPVFGFDIQNEYISGFDTGSWSINY